MPSLETLLTELTCGDDNRAETAAVQFAAFPPQALDPLLQAEEIDRRWWAVRALAGYPPTEAVTDRLANALQDESSEVRQCAALGLCHHPHPQAVPPLIKALTDPDALTARLAASALTQIGAQATPLLIETLKTGTPSARLQAARALSEIKDPRSIPALMAALQADSLLTQYWAEQGLNNLGLDMVYLQPN